MSFLWLYHKAVYLYSDVEEFAKAMQGSSKKNDDEEEQMNVD